MVERELASVECLPCVRYTSHTLSHLTLTITKDVGIIILTLNMKMRLRELLSNFLKSHNQKVMESGFEPRSD